MKKVKTSILVIFVFLFSFAVASEDGECSKECPNGKTISIKPCMTCSFGTNYICCDGENTYCPT